MPPAIFSSLPVLETERLRLRRISLRDADDMYAYAKDPLVTRYVLWEPHRSKWESRAQIKSLIRLYRACLPSSYAIEHKSSGRMIGTIGFMSFNDDDAVAEIGYSLSREFWNQGLMTEAVQKLLCFCFEELGLHRVEAQYMTENPASGRVMEKCGMQYEGHLRGRVCKKHCYKDVEMYAILKDDWQKNKKEG